MSPATITAPPPTQLGPRVETRSLGRWTIHAIQAGGQKLDGGAMFGIVPKPLWQKRITPDERNRIQLGMRCLLIEHDIGPVLIETGAGNKESEKFYDIYGVENRGERGPTALEDGLLEIGVRPEDVALVINTHLHFDHAGGNTVLESDGRMRPAFVNAKYVVQAGEYAFATHTNERTAGSYFPHNFVPLAESHRYDFIEGEREIVAGIRSVHTPGHTPWHQSLLLESGGERMLYIGDLIPTTAHLPLPWIMGYDVEPLVTLETKRAVLRRAAAENWTFMFVHDAKTGWARAAEVLAVA
ncbi:MAG TPA: MBL fold metallo-hydrolase [Gemmatimonadaceae bacterium]|jgi:glyoxylase-like metal-dependent hydrolase (beta-lactamase superfamily II)